jgi:hypothetical protein
MKQFVYYFLLVVVALISAPSNLFAQCTPLDSIPGTAIIDPLPYTNEMPENGIRDTACVGEDFVTVFNLDIPETVAFPPFGNIDVDSVIVAETGVAGLPAGLGFSINPVNRVFYPNTTGCIQVAGVPAAGTEGMYNLTLTVTLYSGFFTTDITLPDPVVAPGEYRLFVRENGNPACQPSSVTETANANYAINVYPNPASDWLTVAFDATTAETTRLSLLDVHGRIVRELLVNSSPGNNRAIIRTNDLSAGFYTLFVNKASAGLRSGVSSRVLIQR